MAAPDKYLEALALQGVADMVKKTGGSVEIAGVKITPCDAYGRTETDRVLERMVDGLQRLSFDFASYRDAAQTAIRHGGGNDYLEVLRAWRTATHAVQQVIEGKYE